MCCAIGNDSNVMMNPGSNGATLLVQEAIVINLVELNFTKYALLSLSMAAMVVVSSKSNWLGLLGCKVRNPVGQRRE